MSLVGDNIGKSFHYHWIFRHIQFSIFPDRPVAIKGKNGVGKSTLLSIMAGCVLPTEGVVRAENQDIAKNQFSTTFVAPYIELPEEFSLNEFLSFHGSFKTPLISYKEMAETASLPLGDVISHFSSGMKQRVRLLTACYFNNNYIFLDEPTTFLDHEGIKWWKNEFEKMAKDKITVLASNHREEIAWCSEVIELKG